MYILNNNQIGESVSASSIKVEKDMDLTVVLEERE